MYLQGDNFGSILIDRGDRSAFQGDGHPSMATANVAFGQPAVYDLVRSALEITDCHSRYSPQGKPGQEVCRFPGGRTSIPHGSYPVYWTLSVCDYFWARCLPLFPAVAAPENKTPTHTRRRWDHGSTPC